MNGNCAKCGAAPVVKNRRYCRDCNRANMREWRRAKRARMAATPVTPRLTVPTFAPSVVAEIRAMARAGATPANAVKALRDTGRIATLEMVKAAWPKPKAPRPQAEIDDAAALLAALERDHTKEDIRRKGFSLRTLDALSREGAVTVTVACGVKIYRARKMQEAA